MDSNTTYLVTNRSASVVVYSIPEDNIKREFQPGETKKIRHAELEKLSYQTGGSLLITNYLLIRSEEAIKELGVPTEPEYFMTEKEVIELIKTGSIDAWLDCLDFAPHGVIEMIKKLSVTVPLNDYEKRRALKEKTGFDVDAAIKHVEEEREERRKSICTSRSFADMIEDEKELVLRVSDFAAKCAQKLREEESAAYDVTTFMYTNRFRDDLAQYFPSATIRLDVAANSAHEIVSAALKAFRTIYRPGYKYKKAGVIVSNIIASDAIQASIFDFDDELRQKHDRLSKVMDAVNSAAEASGSASGRSMLRLATQRPGHYADGIRSDFRSRLYSTSLDDIIEIH